jgi:hypothetical protein
MRNFVSAVLLFLPVCLSAAYTSGQSKVLTRQDFDSCLNKCLTTLLVQSSPSSAPAVIANIKSVRPSSSGTPEVVAEIKPVQSPPSSAPAVIANNQQKAMRRFPDAEILWCLGTDYAVFNIKNGYNWDFECVERSAVYIIDQYFKGIMSKCDLFLKYCPEKVETYLEVDCAAKTLSCMYDEPLKNVNQAQRMLDIETYCSPKNGKELALQYVLTKMFSQTNSALRDSSNDRQRRLYHFYNGDTPVDFLTSCRRMMKIYNVDDSSYAGECDVIRSLQDKIVNILTNGGY